MAKAYGNIAFWAWNEKMEENEIKRQIAMFDEQGYRGFFMHARAGLMVSYLDESWFDAVKIAVETAEKHDMSVYIYDEDGWPSGFAGGRVNALGSDYWIKNLAHTYGSFDDEEKVIARYVKENDAWVRTDRGGKDVLTIYYESDAHYVDLMNPRVTEAFIKVTHEAYEKHVGSYFGRVIKGVFTDEPQVHALKEAWSPYLKDLFKELFGYDMLDHLYKYILPEEKDDGFRHDYRKTINEAFRRHYVKPLSDWCEARGLMLTGHFSAEDGLIHQVAHNGGVMPMYPDFHMPGIDYLGKRLTSPVLLKQVESIKNQFGKPYVLSETFGCAGWDASFAELSWIWGYQAGHGINRATMHGTMYSIKGIRKRDYPAFYSYQEPWWCEMKHLSTWMENINTHLSSGKVINRIGVIHALSSIQSLSLMSEEQRHISNQFRLLVEGLERAQVDFDLVDETLLEAHGKITADRLVMKEQAYELLIVPEMTSIEKNTYEMIEELLERGIRVVFVNKLPTMLSGRPEPELSGLRENVMVLQNRAALWNKFFECIGYERYVTFHDQSGYRLAKELTVSVVFKDQEKLVYVMNKSTIDTKRLFGRFFEPSTVSRISIEEDERLSLSHNISDRTIFSLDLKPMESVLLAFGPVEKTRETPKRSQVTKMLAQASRVTLDHENSFLIDTVRYRIDGGEISEPIPVIRAEERLYKEADARKKDVHATVIYACDIAEPPNRLKLNLESETVKKVSVNGHEVEREQNTYYIDRSIHVFDVDVWKQGYNEIEVDYVIPYRSETIDVEEVYETERNRFYYPTEVENVYLTGDFDVVYDGQVIEKTNHYKLSGGHFEITRSTDKTDDADLTKQGMWFYRGTVSYAYTITKAEGERISIELDRQKTPIVSVIVNGREAGVIWAPPYRLDLTDDLDLGENDVTFKVYSSNRNLLGPHHHYKGEPLFVGVNTFKGVRGFEDFVNIDAKPSTWDDAYHLVFYGLSDVWVIKETSSGNCINKNPMI